MNPEVRYVFDTNVLINAILFESTIRQYSVQGVIWDLKRSYSVHISLLGSQAEIFSV